MSASSQNGYPVFFDNRTTGALPRLRKWVIPGTGRHAFLRDGSAGFLLAHVAHWFDQNIEKIGTGTWDDWGWAVRAVRGQTTGYSNHASGTALDVNATQHPRGVATLRTFTAAEVAEIHAQLKVYEGVIRWGGDYSKSPADAMHFEIDKGLADTERVARKLWDSKHGKPVIDANPGADSVIWDGHIPAASTPAKPAPKPVTPAKPAPAAEHLAVDFSYAKVNPAAIKAAGFRGVVRYLSGNADKDITVAEAHAILGAGLWLLLVWELRAKRAGEGKAAGAADAKAANHLADAVGYPRDAAIIYAVDYDADPATVRDYFAGAHSTPGRPVGIYGSARVIDANLAEYAWQTMAWSHGAVSKLAEMVQRTTHSKTITGAKTTDWDENLLVPGKVIPVWNPGEKPHTPTVVTPTPAPVVTTPVPAPVSTSFVSAQFNTQHTDSGPVGTPQLRAVIKACDLAGLNEVESLWQRLILKTSPRFGAWPLTGAAGADPILWRKSRFQVLAKTSTKAYDGEKHVTPAAYVNEVTLRDRLTGKVVTRINAHPPAHIDDKGRARVYVGAELPKYAHQLERAQAIFTLIRDRIVAATTQGAVVAGADTNVDALAEARLPAAKRTPWFPLTLLGAVAKPVTARGGSLGGRAVDQVLIAGPITSLRAWYGEQGASDHRPVFNELDLNA